MIILWYYDTLTQSTQRQKSSLHIDEEIDRVYFTQGQNIEVHDATHHTNVESKGSLSVVIWNPWKVKSIAMTDMSDDGYKSMLCVETSNTLEDTQRVEVGQTHSLEVHYTQKT